MEKDGPLDGRKMTKIIKTFKWGKSQQKMSFTKTKKWFESLLSNYGEPKTVFLFTTSTGSS